MKKSNRIGGPKKTRGMLLRFSPDEHFHLKAFANERGMTMAKLICEAIRDYQRKCGYGEDSNE